MDPYADEDGNPFSTSAIWRTSFHHLPDLEGKKSLFQPLDLDITSIKLNNPYAPTSDLSRDLRLPHLDTLDYEPLPQLDEIPDHISTSSLSAHELHPPPIDEALHEHEKALEPAEDIWLNPSILTAARPTATLNTWEAFHSETESKPEPYCISEAGPAAFDTALRVRDVASSGKVVRADAFFRALWYLGLGRASLLFPLNEETGEFKQAIAAGRASGFSIEAFQDLVGEFLELGNTTLGLKRFIDKAYVQRRSLAGRVALANALDVVLSAIENHVIREIAGIESFLQLQRLFSRPSGIVSCMRGLVDHVTLAASKEDVVSACFETVQRLEQQSSAFEAVLKTVLLRVSRPWLNSIESAVGLRKQIVRGEAIGAAESDLTFPEFLEEDTRDIIRETTNCVQFLKEHHPQHTLCEGSAMIDTEHALQWCFGWEDIERVSRKAKSYEASLWIALRRSELDTAPLYLNSNNTELESQVLVEHNDGEPSDFTLDIDTAIMQLDSPPPAHSRDIPDELFEIVSKHLSSAEHHDDSASSVLTRPLLSSVSKLSFQPLLLAQRAVLTRATLRSLFHSHDLRLHLSLHHAFHLCSSGTFMTRLTHILFSSDISTAERKRGTMRGGVGGMGLKLGSADRTSWPPPDSEIRLAIMTVLSDSFRATFPDDYSIDRKKQPQKALPGNLSFALKYTSTEETSDADLAKIQNPHSMHALDFLHLSYTPPRALAPLFNERVQMQYDRSFTFLLRVARLQFVVSTQLHCDIFRPERGKKAGTGTIQLLLRFRHEAQIFAGALATHVQGGVEVSWRRFETYLDDMMAELRSDSANVQCSLVALVQKHQDVVDAIAATLLLRKKQRLASSQLLEICENVLEFARCLRENHNNDLGIDLSEEMSTRMKTLFRSFRSKMAHFMNELRTLTNRDDRGEGEGIKPLLEMLENSGFR